MDFLDHVNGLLRQVSGGIELAKSGNPSDVVLQLKETLTKLREDLLSTKEAAIDIREKNLELRSRLRDIEQFDSESDLYERKTLETGSVVYVAKDAGDAGKMNGPYLCAFCFERKTRSYLQPPKKQEFYRDAFTCSVCGYQAAVPNNHKPVVAVGKRTTKWG